MHEAYQWVFVDGFMDRIKIVLHHFTRPSDIILFDNSISHWFVKVCHQINIGIAIYLSIERNTENRLDRKNTEYWKLVILM